MGKYPRGDISPQEFFPMGIFLQGIHLERTLFNGKVFSTFIHTYFVYGMDPAQLLHVV